MAAEIEDKNVSGYFYAANSNLKFIWLPREPESGDRRQLYESSVSLDNRQRTFETISQIKW